MATVLEICLKYMQNVTDYGQKDKQFATPTSWFIKPTCTPHIFWPHRFDLLSTVLIDFRRPQSLGFTWNSAQNGIMERCGHRFVNAKDRRLTFCLPRVGSLICEVFLSTIGNPDTGNDEVSPSPPVRPMLSVAVVIIKVSPSPTSFSKSCWACFRMLWLVADFEGFLGHLLPRSSWNIRISVLARVLVVQAFRLRSSAIRWAGCKLSEGEMRHKNFHLLSDSSWIHWKKCNDMGARKDS